MNHSMTTAQIEDMLSALTDALLGTGDVDGVARRYGVTRTEVLGFVVLIDRLHRVLIGVKPSHKFAHRLRQDLMGAPRMNVLTRIRKLPPRVQIAASVALVATFLLLARRRLVAETRESAAPEIEAAR
jgi:type VI protein secretion system component VasF